MNTNVTTPVYSPKGNGTWVYNHLTSSLDSTLGCRQIKPRISIGLHLSCAAFLIN